MAIYEKVVGTRIFSYKDKKTGYPVTQCIISTQLDNHDDVNNTNSWGKRCSEYWIRNDHPQYTEATQLKDKDEIIPIMNGRFCNGFIVKGKA